MHSNLPVSFPPCSVIVMADCGTCTPLEALERMYAPYGRETYSVQVPVNTSVSPMRYSLALEATLSKP